MSAAQASENGKRSLRRQSSPPSVTPQLRHPGAEVGPRATRTIAAILSATSEVFLTRGYAGTTIDHITRIAGVSRASFYTYFPSKRDALLALGADSHKVAMETAESLGEIASGWEIEDLESWVERYLSLLDGYGSFSLAWTQAAHEDEEIRRAGRRSHLELCRCVGMALASLGGTDSDDPVEVGLLVVAMLERGWAYSRLYRGDLDRAALNRAAARLLAAATGK